MTRVPTSEETACDALGEMMVSSRRGLRDPSPGATDLGCRAARSRRRVVDHRSSSCSSLLLRGRFQSAHAWIWELGRKELLPADCLDELLRDSNRFMKSSAHEMSKEELERSGNRGSHGSGQKLYFAAMAERESCMRIEEDEGERRDNYSRDPLKKLWVEKCSF